MRAEEGQVLEGNVFVHCMAVILHPHLTLHAVCASSLYHI